MTDEPNIIILEKGNFCEYHPRMDVIVISKCYNDDDQAREFLMAHELEHRRIHKSRGYWGIFNHVWLDWKTRVSFIGKNYDVYKRIHELDPGDEVRIKEMFFQIIYIIMTAPTALIQLLLTLMSIMEKRGKKNG